MKHRYLLPIVLMTTATACAVDTSPSDAVGQTAEAVSTAGVSASLSVSVSGSTYSATMTVKNGSAEPQTNWQVLVDMGPTPSDPNKSLIHPSWPAPSGAAAVSGAYFNDLGSKTLFMPTSATATIAAGASQTITWTGDWNGVAPTVVSVDGMASGSASAGNAADGLDPIALSAATAALHMAYDYEKDKLANTGDPSYPLYDETVWAAQSFRVAAGNATIEFDPSAPGYSFVPNSAKADLAFAQLDPTVASYLTAGLVSCLSVTDGWHIYAFRADFLKGFAYPTSHSGSVTNADGSVDSFRVSGTPIGKGQQAITVSASSGPTNPDPSFGVLRDMSVYPNFPRSVTTKFMGAAKTVGTNPSSWKGHYSAACTPFNGPGGSTNPYLVINQNGGAVGAWFQGLGTACQNGCSGTLVADPVPYAEPGAYYDVGGNMMGTQSNPFSILGTLYATSDHAGQWATRTVNSMQEWGTFTTPVTIFGVTEYKYVKKM